MRALTAVLNDIRLCSETCTIITKNGYQAQVSKVVYADDNDLVFVDGKDHLQIYSIDTISTLTPNGYSEEKIVEIVNAEREREFKIRSGQE